MVSIGPPARRAALTAFSSFFADAFGAFFLTTTGSQSCVKGPTPAISDGELRLDENNCHIAIHHHINSHTGTSCRHWKVKLLWHHMMELLLFKTNESPNSTFQYTKCHRYSPNKTTCRVKNYKHYPGNWLFPSTLSKDCRNTTPNSLFLRDDDGLLCKNEKNYMQ